MSKQRVILKKVGIIYKVTNNVNKKIYIGQTEYFEGNEQEGVEKRLMGHISDTKEGARKGKFACPAFHQAINKYGETNFTTEVIKICHIEEIDNWEVQYIAQYKSTKKSIGYNISTGGKGTHYDNSDDRAREKMSKRLKKDSSVELNILPYNRNDKHVGYIVKRGVNGKKFTKWFTSTKYTLDENLAKAHEWLNELKKDEIDLKNLEIKKETLLPKNIGYSKNKKGDIIGYRAWINVDKKTYAKEFCKKSESMEEKFIQATKYLKELKEFLEVMK